jgi:hypothetical protein
MLSRYFQGAFWLPLTNTCRAETHTQTPCHVVCAAEP